jgi:hypothetical protein
MFLCLYYIIENVVVALSASGSFIGIGDDVLLNINHQGTTYYAVYCMISIQHLIRFAKIHSVTVLSSIDRLGQKLVLNRTRNFESDGPYHPYHPYINLRGLIRVVALVRIVRVVQSKVSDAAFQIYIL